MSLHLLLVLFVTIEALRPPEVRISTCPEKEDSIFSHAAVVTNSEVCTNIALEILSEEGSAADAAIAALLCEGVTNPQSMGLGGGFLLTYYNNATKKVEYLNAREAAPMAASPNMFGPISDKDIATGGLSVAVPGELMGYWALHKKYGRVSWYDLFRPAIDLCREGVEVTPYTGRMIAKVADEIATSPSIKSLLTNLETGKLYKEGDLMRRPDLADTLEDIAMHGPRALYDGKLTEEFVYDIKENGGIITVEDMRSYRAMWYSSYQKNIGPYTVHTVPPPGAGPLLMLVLSAMSKKMSCDEPLFWHRLVETWKFAYGYRGSISGPFLGEKDATCLPSKQVNDILRKMLDSTVYNCTKDYLLNVGGDVFPEDHGTSHISIVASNGDAISVTSTINLSFGALFVSESTGIILNNQMVDFSIPYHYSSAQSNIANLISPNRQPMSSMLPTIITDTSTGNLRLVIGASGGFKILTATSTVILLHLFRDVRLEEAVRHKRLHHQLRPMVLEYEDGFPDDLLTSFIQRGHRLMLAEPNCKTSNGSSQMTTMHSCVNAVGVVPGEIHAVADFRRKAISGGF